MRILIIEDNETIATTLGAMLEECDMQPHICTDFSQAKSKLDTNQFDIVILDLMLDVTELPGLDVAQQIFEGTFFPVIVYSAKTDAFSTPESAFVRKISKVEDGSMATVVATVAEFRPHVSAIRSLKQQLNATINGVLYHSANALWGAMMGSESDLKEEVLVRSAKRHVAAQCDLPSTGAMMPWERYLHPPISQHLMLADILKMSGVEHATSSSNAGCLETAFRLIVTPTCDLCKGKGMVLTAKCKPFSVYEKAVGVDQSTAAKKKREKIKGTLNDAQVGGLIVLPQFGTLLPAMVADLRDLQVMSYTGTQVIDESEQPFERTVSIDSPFRERIAWAWMEISGRAGVPVVDTQTWVNELIPDK